MFRKPLISCGQPKPIAWKENWLNHNVPASILPAALCLIVVTACSTPSGSATPPADSSQHAAAAEPAFPALPEKQRQFCAAFQGAWKESNDFDAKAAAAGDNPIARQAVEKNRPNYFKTRDAREVAAMGDGSFQDWIGHVGLRVEGNKAFVTIQFPCPGAGPLSNDVLNFGNEWRHGFVPRPASAGIAVESPLGQSLATLQPEELVAVSGSLACKADAGCYETYDSPAPALEFSAQFTSIRSLKAGH